MERIITDVQVYANMLIDELNRIKDHHRDILNSSEIDTINDTCNLIYHNREELLRP